VPNNDVKKSFGAAVKFWRNQRGISQEALAERSDMHRTYICDVERGTRNVSLETIERIARALEVTPGNLLSDYSGLSPRTTSLELLEILLVEDNPDDAELTLHALQRANIANKVHLVRDGVEALDFLFSKCSVAQLPQLVLLDLNLPKIHGMEVLREIRTNPKTRSLSVIVLTVSSRSQDVAESQRLGAKGYLVKPVQFQNFSEVVPKLNLQWAVLKPPVVARTKRSILL
jgi:two-component system response regulator